MAIAGKVENEYGAEFTYHKIKDVRINSDDKSGITLKITVYSWLNKEARISGKKPSMRDCFILNADFAMTPFYKLLKAKFKDFNIEDDFDNSFKDVIPDENKPLPVFVEQTAQGEPIKSWTEKKGE